MAFKTIIIIAVGGSLGSLLRHWFVMTFTHGVLFSNLLGCFLIGIFVSYFSRYAPQAEQARNFLLTGLLGGFTTFSSFGLLTVEHGKQNLFYAGAYILLHVGGGLACVVLGMMLGLLVL
jgi:fluoride exporter